MSDAQAVLDQPFSYTAQNLRFRNAFFGYVNPPEAATEGWGVSVKLNLLDSNDEVVAQRRFFVQNLDENGIGQASVVGEFLLALETPLPDETGGFARKRNYRVLSWLIAKGVLTGVTVAP